MNITTEMPLVTIGLPSYNRPEGLKRSLENAISQTYQNLEIIVGDNCSDDEMAINAVVEPFMKKDKRIRYFRHAKNGGALLNFKFLLQKATGEYFMWIADDDERHETCVERSLEIIGKEGGAFGTYDVKNRYYNITHVHKVPTISNNMSLHKRLLKFIAVFPSVYIYGLYKTKCLEFFLNEKEGYDFMDGYFAMYVLINYGLNVRPTEYSIITLGINEKNYVPKPFTTSANKLLTYKPVIKKCYSLIWGNKQLNIFSKLFLLSFFLVHMAKQYVTYEHPYRFAAKVLNTTVRLPLRLVYRFIKTIAYK